MRTAAHPLSEPLGLFDELARELQPDAFDSALKILAVEGAVAVRQRELPFGEQRRLGVEGAEILSHGTVDLDDLRDGIVTEGEVDPRPEEAERRHLSFLDELIVVVAVRPDWELHISFLRLLALVPDDPHRDVVDAHASDLPPALERAGVGGEAQREAPIAQEVLDSRRRHVEATAEVLWRGDESPDRLLQTLLDVGDFDQIVREVCDRAARVDRRAFLYERPVAVCGVEVL